MCQITPIETEAPVVTGPQVFTYFPTLIYTDQKPEFLDVVREVSDEYIEKAKADHDLNEIYPVYMTGSFYDDPRLAAFSQAVGQAAWDVLNGQGYNMNGLNTFFTEMWCQQHYKNSSMEQHVHGFGSQIVGFYFLETPEGGSNVVFHDPRAGKVQIDLPEQDMNMATAASKMINFTPKPGMMIFSNSWLSHSFTRNGSEYPVTFIHFNLSVIANPPAPAAEVI
jgi:uncharacterized protein (TIGR02466 family)